MAILNFNLRLSIVCRLLALLLVFPLVANGDDDYDESLSVIRSFFVAKRNDIVPERINPEYGCDGEEVIKWLAGLQTNAQMRPDDKRVWEVFSPALWAALYHDQGDDHRAVRCDDEKLFTAFLAIYLTPTWSRAKFFVEWKIWRGFDKRLIDKYADSLMRPFLSSATEYESLLSDCVIPKHFVKRFPEFFRGRFAINRDKALKSGKSLLAKFDYSVFNALRFNAYYGEIAETEELIAAFRSWPCDADADFESVFPFYALLDAMFQLASQEALVAVLSRFPEEIGAPEFDVSGFKRPSPRYTILCRFKRLYPDDPFFVKYQRYLWRRGGWYMDEDIGGEAGVQKLFEEFRAWAKDKFGYDMDLSKSTPHINLQRCVIE